MPKTVIFKLAGLGDLLMTTPGIRAFKKSFPGNHVSFLIGISNQDVLKNNPYVDEIITIDDEALLAGSFTEKLKETFRLLNILRKIKPDEVFILHRDWRYNCVSLLSRIPVRYGFRRDLKGLFLTQSVETSSGQHEIHKYLSLFSLKEGFKADGISMDLYPTEKDTMIVEEFFQGISKTSPLIAMAPGGAINVKQEKPDKRWPLEYYSKLIGLLLENGLKVLLVGGPLDLKFTLPLVNVFKRFSGNHIFDISGKLSIQATYLALKKCELLVTHDCGPMHLGASAGIPVVSIFGPTNSVEFRPIINNRSLYLWLDDPLSCIPCSKGMRFPDCPRKGCMYGITPEMVYSKAMEILR